MPWRTSSTSGSFAASSGGRQQVGRVAGGPVRGTPVQGGFKLLRAPDLSTVGTTGSATPKPRLPGTVGGSRSGGVQWTLWTVWTLWTLWTPDLVKIQCYARQ